MPSKKSNESKKRNRKMPAEWKDNEVIEVLAWADYSFQIDPTWKEFDESVESHLLEACQIEYTLTQVRRKLGTIWHAYGRDGVSEKPNLIYQEGSQCLENPSFVWHEDIARRVKAIAHAQFVEQLSTRITRSASKSDSRSLLRPRSRLDGDVVASQSPRKKAKPRAVSQSPCPKTRTVDRKCIQDAGTGGLLLLPKKEGWYTPPDTPYRQSVVQDTFREDSLDTDSGSDQEHDNSPGTFLESKPVQDCPKPSRKLEATSCTSSQQPLCGSGRANTSTQTGLDAEKEQRHDLEAQLRTLQKKHEATLAFFSTQLEARTAEAKDFTQRLQSLETVLQASRKGLSLEELLADSRNKRNTLEKTLAERRLLHPFSSLPSTEGVLCDKGYVDSAMRLMGGEINGLARLDNTQTCDFSAVAETSDSVLLIARAFPCAEQPNGPATLMDRIPQALRLNEFIRTLVAAAVCCWVFDSPLEFLHTSSPCQLLSQYRQCLDIQDGPEVLRNLDFAAHMMLLGEDFFHKHVVPTEARCLTVRFCEIFKPLFAQQDLIGFTPQSSLYKPTETGFDDMSSLQRIFESALEVKARLVLSANVFEAVMYAPGTPFSKTRMVARNRRGMLENIPRHQRPELICCYLPALVEHEATKHLVDHNNFIQSVQANKSRLIPFSRALVLV